MARPRQKNLVEQLADAGEEAIRKLGSAPGADRLLSAVNALRDRTDEMQRKMRGFDAFEKRLAAIERRLDKLEGKGKPARRSTTTRKRTTTKRSTSASRAQGTTGSSGS